MENEDTEGYLNSRINIFPPLKVNNLQVQLPDPETGSKEGQDKNSNNSGNQQDDKLNLEQTINSDRHSDQKPISPPNGDPHDNINYLKHTDQEIAEILPKKNNMYNQNLQQLITADFYGIDFDSHFYARAVGESLYANDKDIK